MPLLILLLLYPQLYALTYHESLSFATSCMVSALVCVFAGCFTRYDDRLLVLLVLAYLSLPHLPHLFDSLWQHSFVAIIGIWTTGILMFRQIFSSAKKVMTEAS